MADYCKQCSIAIFGEDFGDLKGLGNSAQLLPDQGWEALCEGCGPTLVNGEGECLCDCYLHHKEPRHD